jgi:hypothetical protein
MPTKLSPSRLDSTKDFSSLVPSAFAQANAAFAQANTGGSSTDSWARDQANASFGAANSASLYANAAFAAANAGGGGSSSDTWARGQANASFDKANSANTLAQSGFNVSNAAFIQANAVFSQSNNQVWPQANAAFIQANAVFSQSNNQVWPQANAAFNAANSAYTRANNTVNANTGGTITGNTTITGNLIVTNTSTAISNTTGALQVIGGLGVVGNVYTGAITIRGSTANGITFADGTTQFTANAGSGGGTSYISSGTSNVSILTSSGNIYMNVGGVNIVNVSSTWANVTGNIAATSIYATSNIITANIRTTGSSGNISGANYVTANYFSGNGSLLTNISGANVTGDGSSLTNLKPNTHMTIALSDESTAITTGVAKITFRAPFAMTLYQIPRASLSTASTSGIPEIDINKNAVSIFSTRLTIDANEKTSVTAATAAVLSTTTFADDDEITMDIDVAGTGAKGLKVTLYYRRT